MKIDFASRNEDSDYRSVVDSGAHDGFVKFFGKIQLDIARNSHWKSGD